MLHSCSLLPSVRVFNLPRQHTCCQHLVSPFSEHSSVITASISHLACTSDSSSDNVPVDLQLIHWSKSKIWSHADNYPVSTGIALLTFSSDWAMHLFAHIPHRLLLLCCLHRIQQVDIGVQSQPANNPIHPWPL